jgi:hypothetical protein
MTQPGGEQHPLDCHSRRVTMIYGLLDMETKFWLGDKIGPRLYENECRAWFAVGRSQVHFGWKDGRLLASPYPVGHIVEIENHLNSILTSPEPSRWWFEKER